MKNFFSVFLLSLLAACGGGGDDELSVPLATAVDVKVAFDTAPQLVNNYSVQTSAERGNVEMVYLDQSTSNDPYHLIVRYKSTTIYDKAIWGIYSLHGIASDGTDMILLSEYSSPGSWSGESVVFINGEKVPAIQFLPVRFSGKDYPATDYPAAVRDIREYRDGWLIIFATIYARGGYYVNRWAMYRPRSGEFVDCGELDSEREPSWGPSVSMACVHH